MSNQWKQFTADYHHNCFTCGTVFINKSAGGRYCETCKNQPDRICIVCKTPFNGRGTSKKACSRVCGNKVAASKRTGPRPEEWKNSLRLAQQKRATSDAGRIMAEMHSKRMLTNNPMSNPDIIAKMVETKKKNGTLTPEKPWQGGNGREPSIQQKSLH
jgi:hypothetical protein